MTARVLDGQALARKMQEEIRPEVAAFTAQHGRPPGLGIVLVGDDPASEVYVRNKLKAGADVGFRADLERLPASASLSNCRKGWVLSIRTISIGGFPFRQWAIGISGLATGMMLAILLH